jgi:hypothetical protein
MSELGHLEELNRIGIISLEKQVDDVRGELNHVFINVNQVILEMRRMARDFNEFKGDVNEAFNRLSGATETEDDQIRKWVPLIIGGVLGAAAGVLLGPIGGLITAAVVQSLTTTIWSAVDNFKSGNIQEGMYLTIEAVMLSSMVVTAGRSRGATNSKLVLDTKGRLGIPVEAGVNGITAEETGTISEGLQWTREQVALHAADVNELQATPMGSLLARVAPQRAAALSETATGAFGRINEIVNVATELNTQYHADEIVDYSVGRMTLARQAEFEETVLRDFAVSGVSVITGLERGQVAEIAGWARTIGGGMYNLAGNVSAGVLWFSETSQSVYRSIRGSVFSDAPDLTATENAREELLTTRVHDG